MKLKSLSIVQVFWHFQGYKEKKLALTAIFPLPETLSVVELS